MQVKIAALAAAFTEIKKVREAVNAYCLAPDKVPVSLDDLTMAVEQIYDIKISITLVPLNSRLLRGMIEIYPNRASIYIDAELNTPWTRYVQVKEIGHIMVMNADNCTNDPTALIEYCVQAGLLAKDDGEHPSDILTEEVTKFVAVELLFPPELREPAKRRIAAGEDTLFTIAEWLHIPEHLVEFALTDKYMGIAAALRASA
jgi:hypothetical protein